MYNYGYEIAIFGAVIFQYLYAFYFLPIKKEAAYWAKISLIFIAIRTLIFIIFIFTQEPELTLLIIDGITLIPLYISSVVVFRKGFVPARLFIVGNFFFYIGFIVHGLESLGLFSHTNIFTVYAAQIGIILEMMAQILGFADKLNFERREKIAAQSKLIHSLQEKGELQKELIIELQEKEFLKDKVNRELEDKVAERTLKLQYTIEQVALQSKKIEELNIEMDRAIYFQKKEHKVSLTEKVFHISSDSDFDAIFKTDHDCLTFILQLKWNPYHCSKCNGINYQDGVKPFTRRCINCNYIDSITSNTILHGSRISPLKAFKIITHIIQQRKESLENLSIELNLRKATVYDFAKRIRENISNHNIKSMEELFLKRLKN